MFHLLLALPTLIAAGAFAVCIAVIPFWVGIGLELIFAVFSRERSWPRYLPLALGLLGLILSLVFLREILHLSTILIYWGVYCVCIWLVSLVVREIRGFIARRREG